MIDFNLQPKSENGPAYEMRLFEQFSNSLDPRLRAVMLEVARWSKAKFDKRLIYTCVNRTEAENIDVGGSKNSAHLFGRALDIRVHNLTDDEVNHMVGYINMHWLKDDPWLYVIVHGKGSNRHMHINIKYKYTHGSFAK